MKKIHLIRHGRTRADNRGLYCGSTDLPLTKSGAAALRDMASRYPSPAHCRLYTSGATCAEQTLRLIWGNLPHEKLPALREMHFGIFEMHSYAELKDDPAYIEWITGDNDANPCPEGESGAILKKRAIAAFTALSGTAEDAIVVTHGGVIAAIMTHLFSGEGKNRYSWQPAPGNGYTIHFEGLRPSGYERIPTPPPPGETETAAPQDWQTKNYSFFSHKSCEFFPCHETNDPDNFNCLFCYCPLYVLGDKCGGNFIRTNTGVKDCSRCRLPHERGSFGYVTENFSRIQTAMSLAEQSTPPAAPTPTGPKKPD